MNLRVKKMKQIKIELTNEEYAKHNFEKKEATWKDYLTRGKHSLYYEAKTLLIIKEALESYLLTAGELSHSASLRIERALDVVCMDLYSKTYKEYKETGERR